MRVQIKLLVAFLFVSLTGSLVAGAYIWRMNQLAYKQLRDAQASEFFANDLIAHYEKYGSWDDLGTKFAPLTGNRPRPPQAQPPPNSGNQPPARQANIPPPLVIYELADTTGKIIFPVSSNRAGKQATPPELTEGFPIVVQGEHVGTVLAITENTKVNLPEQRYFNEVNQALLIGAIGGTAVAVILGLLFAQAFTKPLLELAQATHAMSEGQLKQEVTIRTNDEIGELAEAFNNMSAELTHVNQLRRQMTADIAHDLRTPITVLSGYLEVMQDGTLPPSPRRLAMMADEVETLKRLVLDLRTLTLADTGQLRLATEPVNLAELLEQVRMTFAHQAEQKEIRLQVETVHSLPIIQADKQRLRQVLGNLISNALKHTPAQGKIILGGLLQQNKVQLHVTDTGEGIAQEKLPHIFERFYRAETAREGDSSGLGLAIVKSLVEAHGGHVNAVSPAHPDQTGTSFKVWLPTM